MVENTIILGPLWRRRGAVIPFTGGFPSPIPLRSNPVTMARVPLVNLMGAARAARLAALRSSLSECSDSDFDARYERLARTQAQALARHECHAASHVLQVRESRFAWPPTPLRWCLPTLEDALGYDLAGIEVACISPLSEDLGLMDDLQEDADGFADFRPVSHSIPPRPAALQGRRTPPCTEH